MKSDLVETMLDWLIATLGIIGGILLLWVALLTVLWVQQRRVGSNVDWRSMLRWCRTLSAW